MQDDTPIRPMYSFGHPPAVVEQIEDGRGTGYTAMAIRIDPDAHPDLERAGYRSETTLFHVFGSAQPEMSHDPHDLARRLPGNARWVVDELRKLEELLEGKIEEVTHERLESGPDLEPQIDEYEADAVLEEALEYARHEEVATCLDIDGKTAEDLTVAYWNRPFDRASTDIEQWADAYLRVLEVEATEGDR